jgi:hypothetical protein
MRNNQVLVEWETHMRVTRAQREAEQARLARELGRPRERRLYLRTAELALNSLRRLAAVGLTWSSEHAPSV